ncbi:MAG TPA: ACP S-malonyltransferase [Syntrophales bacterium]|nr:ACP S-malonyltransferase [Syntrophales bacterium]HOM07399.1 ACP S-malonyltransferase [Syntrophales bacterium]HON99972.1 ACP S-malonyltransferase [Syntrophales bacterium]HPC01491.1 ACP S-malonyltransferase [Syntrophales bacterium]HPQ07041.1 ACP S-malonyltransferase [Syntrophales bacterium]
MGNIDPSIAVVFPGQGAQRPGMGRDFHAALAVCRDTYEEASAALGWDVARVCFDDDERLDLTAFTQPCLLTTQIAMLRGLKELYGLEPSVYGGHSLGEFTALVAAGVLTLTDAVRIVEERGRLMQEASPVGRGGMAAVIAPEVDVEAVGDALSDLPVDIANVNSPRQVVISGWVEALPEAEARIGKIFGGNGDFRFVPLNVSAPFHSRFMRPVEGVFRLILDSLAGRLRIGESMAVTSNFSGRFHVADREAILGALTRQLASPVRWVENMKEIAAKASVIYEVGPARPLREFFRAMGVECRSVTSLATARRIFAGDAMGVLRREEKIHALFNADTGVMAVERAVG